MPTIPSGCSATTATMSWVASWIVNLTLVPTTVWSPWVRITASSLPNAGGWAYSTYRLVRLRRQVDRRAEPGLALRPAGQPELTGDGRPVVDEVDLDRHPRADPGVARQQGVGLDRGEVRRGRAGRQRAEHRERDPERREHAPGAPRDPTGRRLGTRTSSGDGARSLPLTVCPGLIAAWTPRLGRKLHGRGRSVGGYRTMLRSREPGCVPPSRGGSCPRSARSGRSDTTSRRSAIRPASSRRHTTSSAASNAIACWRATRPTSSGWTCRARKPAMSPTIGIAERPGRLPAGVRTGRSTRTRIHRSTSTSRPTRPRDRHLANPGRVLRAASARAVRTGVWACFRTSGPWPGRGRTATSCCGRPGSTPARWWSCMTTRRPPARPSSTRSAPGSRTSRSSTTTASSTGCGPCRRTGRPRRRSPRCWPRPPAIRSRSPTGIIATKPRCATATSGGCRDRARRIRRSTTC